MFRLSLLPVVACAVLGTFPVQSAVITIYTNQANFIAATPGGFDPTGMSAITTNAAADIAINAADTIYGAGDGIWTRPGTDNWDFSFEHVTFSARPTIAASVHRFQSSTALIAGVEYNIYNAINENHNIYFHGAGALAFGFKGMDSTAGGVCGGGTFVNCGNSSFNITIYNDATSFGTFNFNPPFSNTSVGYFGILSDTPFTRIQVSEVTSHSEPYDNEVFGEYRLLQAPPPPEEPPASVPAPAGALVLVFGLMGLTMVRRREGRGQGALLAQ